MSYSVRTANADLAAVLHGTNLNKINNLEGLHNRTARQLLADIDPQETIRKVLTTTPLFNNIWDYACPSDLKGNKIIDISPQFIRDPSYVVGQEYNQDFDIDKNSESPISTFNVLFNTGQKTLRINDGTLTQGVVINSCDDTTGWKLAGVGGANLYADNVNFAEGTASISFDVTGAQGGAAVTLSTPVDISGQNGLNSVFVYVYIPDASKVTTIYVTWGSASTDYYYQNLSVTNEGTAFVDGWNLLRADQLTALVNGSPDDSSIAYANVLVTMATLESDTGFKIDNIVSTVGKFRTLTYYSNCLFRNATTGAFQETVTDDTNLINLSVESYNLYQNLLAFYAMQQVQGISAVNFDSNFFGQEYQKNKERYTSLYKSQIQKPESTYYLQQQAGYGKYLGRRWGL